MTSFNTEPAAAGRPRRALAALGLGRARRAAGMADAGPHCFLPCTDVSFEIISEWQGGNGLESTGWQASLFLESWEPRQGRRLL